MNRLKSVGGYVLLALLVFVVPMVVWETDGNIEGEGGSEGAAGSDPARAARTKRDPQKSGVDFIEVEGGKFLMGAQATDPAAPGYDAAAGKDEGPPWWVTVDSFSIQRTEVTAPAYQKCISALKCPAVSTDRPMSTLGRESKLGLSVNFVSWDEAVQYCAFIDARLPTEAEWEYVARGKTGERFPYGDVLICPVKEFVDANPRAGATGTGSGPDVEGPSRPLSSPCDRIAEIATDNFEEQEVKALEQMFVGSFHDIELDLICAALGLKDEAETVALLRELKKTGSVQPLRDLRGDGFAELDKLKGSDVEPTQREDKQPVSVEGAVPSVELNCALNEPPNPNDMVGDHPLGVEQLAGGMWEWVADHYSETYVSTGDNINPTGPETGTRRVQRGGGWMSSLPLDFRGAARASLAPSVRMPDVGFRCVRSL
jgi:formylglycine-generating enzyme required for sulfatase activity